MDLCLSPLIWRRVWLMRITVLKHNKKEKRRIFERMSIYIYIYSMLKVIIWRRTFSILKEILLPPQRFRRCLAKYKKRIPCFIYMYIYIYIYKLKNLSVEPRCVVYKFPGENKNTWPRWNERQIRENKKVFPYGVRPRKRNFNGRHHQGFFFILLVK